MAGGASFSDDNDELISGINVTPLVDVVLVLLIIFLITAPVIYQSAIKVQLPRAQTGEEAEKSPLSFTISKDGQLSWNKETLDWNTLPQRLSALGPGISEQTATISADEATPHGTVIRLMDALRQAGLTRFAMNVESSAPANISGK
jgi:biopolymer transport protein ExbD